MQDERANERAREINYTDWYRFVGRFQFRKKEPALQIFWFKEVVNIKELDYSNQMVKKTEQLISYKSK